MSKKTGLKKETVKDMISLAWKNSDKIRDAGVAIGGALGMGNRII